MKTMTHWLLIVLLLTGCYEMEDSIEEDSNAAASDTETRASADTDTDTDSDTDTDTDSDTDADTDSDTDADTDTDTDADTDSSTEEYIDCSGPDVWYDSTSGLCWENPGEDSNMRFFEASNTCQFSFVGGYDDWRLPNIDELRSLIRDCPETETGGVCPIEDGSSYLDISVDCEGCGTLTDSLLGRCFQDPILIGDCIEYWSSSIDNHVYVVDHVWTVVFRSASLEYIEETSHAKVRCVREIS